MAISATYNNHFEQLMKSGKPVGEVVGVDRFTIRVSGLQPINVNALVIFENGDKGYVHQIFPDYVNVLSLGKQSPAIGSLVVLQYNELVCKVGKDYVGRVVSVTGDPLDGKGPIAADATWPVFNDAPPLIDRELLTEQLETGVVSIDSLVPIVRGQRMALLGDSKSGKTTILTQLAINQKNTDQIIVYVLIAKRRNDINTLLDRLTQTGSMSKAIVVVSTVFESLIQSYLAPYVGCAMAEYLWQVVGQDTIIVYDDLTAHAQAAREIALLSGTNPGRASYPGDIFYTHASLLERAGRLRKTKKHLTSLPIVLADDGDITQYLPTNLMAMTDGQWILDLSVFRKNIRPALNLSLSVTRIGGAGQNERQKQLAAQTLKFLADYRAAETYSHFGSELASETQKQLARGKLIYEVLTQGPTETYSLMAQQLMLDIVLRVDTKDFLDTNLLKKLSNEYALKIKKNEDYDTVLRDLATQVIAEPKK